jgi:hypothetical protein
MDLDGVNILSISKRVHRIKLIKMKTNKQQLVVLMLLVIPTTLTIVTTTTITAQQVVAKSGSSRGQTDASHDTRGPN